MAANEIEQIYSDYLSLNNDNTNAKESLAEFFENEDYSEILNIGYSQRAILVSGKYRKDITYCA